MQGGAFCCCSNRPHLTSFSSLNVFLSLDFCHFVFWHIAYLSLYLGLWSRHLPNPPVPLCQAQPPTTDPAIETTAHDIIRARPTHSRNKERPTFTPIPTRWPTFPNCIRYRIFSGSWFYAVFLMWYKMSHQTQIEFFKQTDEYKVHCLLLSLSSSLTLNPTTKHICTKNAQ